MYGEVSAAVYRQALVDTPAYGAVVDDDILEVHAAEAVALMLVDMAVAAAEAHVAYYDIVGTDGKRIVGNAYSATGRGLAGNGHVAVVEPKRRCQVDGARHIEDDGARPFLIACPAERALLVGILECGDMVDSAAAPTCSIAAEALGAGKSQLLLFAFGHGICRE